MNFSRLHCVCLLLLLGLSLIGNIGQLVESPVSTVYYTDDGTNIDVKSPHLEIRIVKSWAAWRQAGRISSIKYKGGPNIVQPDPRFGTISIWNPASGITRSMSPVGMILGSATGNSTGKLTLTLTASSIIQYDTGGNSLSVDVTLKYTFYADFDAVFTYVTIDSFETTWLNIESTYAQSFALAPFTSYNTTGVSYIGSFKAGSLAKSGSYILNDAIDYNIITVKNASNNIAVTLAPTTISNNRGSLHDATTATSLWLGIGRPRLWDGSWIDHGRYMRDIRYGAVWIFHDATAYPFIVTPWIMPNAVPYGIMQSYDEIPVSGSEYNKISPSADTPLTSAWFTWLDANPKRRVDLMLNFNYKVDTYTPSANGVDNSWAWNGSVPLFNSSWGYRTWLQGLEGKRIGFGLHGYHHDSPWEHEFSTVTNTTWITRTWDRFYADFRTLGLTNNTLTHWKAPGYKLRGKTLETIPNYDVKLLHTSLTYNVPPLYATYTHLNGKKVIESLDTLVIVDEIYAGKNVNDVYNWAKENITRFGLVSIQGHVNKLQSKYIEVNSVFSQLETYLGDNLDYFLFDEITSYWYDVLLPLEYSYNSTTLTTSSSDSRLTFKMLNKPYSISNGLVYEAGSFTLHAPNINTGSFKFAHFSGYATLSNLKETSQKLTFTVCAPSETLSTTRILVGDKGEPRNVSATNGILSWNYNSSTRAVTLNLVHASSARIIVDWRIPGDVNGDSYVDVFDLVSLSKAFGSKPGDPNWNEDADINYDNIVDVYDAWIMSTNWTG